MFDEIIDYDPPLNRIGYGLNILDKYDGGDNSWLDYHNQEGECYIAYHGTNGRFVNNILNEGLKKGGRQQCKNSNNINPLSQQEFRKSGEGVYLSTLIKVDDEYSSDKQHQKKIYSNIM